MVIFLCITNVLFSVHVAKIQGPHGLPAVPETEMGSRLVTHYQAKKKHITVILMFNPKQWRVSHDAFVISTILTWLRG